MYEHSNSNVLIYCSSSPRPTSKGTSASITASLTQHLSKLRVVNNKQQVRTEGGVRFHHSRYRNILDKKLITLALSDSD